LKITTLTTISKQIEKFTLKGDKKFLTRDQRVVGFFSDVSKAKSCLIEQSENLFEYYYEYAVIEVLEEGLYPNVVFQEWFIYDKTIEKYIPCKEPEDFKNTINISIG